MQNQRKLDSASDATIQQPSQSYSSRDSCAGSGIFPSSHPELRIPGAAKTRLVNLQGSHDCGFALMIGAQRCGGSHGRKSWAGWSCNGFPVDAKGVWLFHADFHALTVKFAFRPFQNGWLTHHLYGKCPSVLHTTCFMDGCYGDTSQKATTDGLSP